MADDPKIPTPPYLPYKTWMNYINTLRSGIPGRIDRTVMPSVSGGMQSWILAALRYFDLITDEGRPTDRLSKFVQADVEARVTMLRGMLKTGYPGLMRDEAALKQMTGGQLEDEFKKFKLAGRTMERCVAFFTSMAKDAGVELSSFIKKKRQRRTTSGTRANGRRPDPPAAKGDTHPVMSNLSGGASASMILTGYFAKLPQPGAVWAKEERLAWIAGIQSAFDLEYKSE